MSSEGGNRKKPRREPAMTRNLSERSKSPSISSMGMHRYRESFYIVLNMFATLGRDLSLETNTHFMCWFLPLI